MDYQQSAYKVIVHKNNDCKQISNASMRSGAVRLVPSGKSHYLFYLKMSNMLKRVTSLCLSDHAAESSLQRTVSA